MNARIIHSTEELDEVLQSCKAKPISEPTPGGNFYHIMSQQFTFPDGSIVTREFVEKRKATVVVPIMEDGSYVFVVQPISLSREGVLMQFPAGSVEQDESGERGGLRELAEETGYTTDEPLTYVGDFYQDPGCIKQTVGIYIARNCRRTTEQSLDKDEYIIPVEIPKDIVATLIDKGYIRDANTFIALQKSLLA